MAKLPTPKINAILKPPASPKKKAPKEKVDIKANNVIALRTLRGVRKQMKCGKCGYPDSEVLRTLINDNNNYVKRRRKCLRCEYRFTTQEDVRGNQYVEKRTKTK